MLSPKSKIILHKSQPSPVLSGQFTVITAGSPGFSAWLITTTSSCNIPILTTFSLYSPSLLSLSLSLFAFKGKNKARFNKKGCLCLCFFHILEFLSSFSVFVSRYCVFSLLLRYSRLLRPKKVSRNQSTLTTRELMNVCWFLVRKHKYIKINKKIYIYIYI